LIFRSEGHLIRNREITFMEEVCLRPAELKDIMVLWKTRNDPETRKYSLSLDYIPYSNYKRWLETALNSDLYALFIITDSQNQPIGQVRFAFNAGLSAEVSIALLWNQRGRGYGTAALLKALEIGYRRFNLNELYALIKSENIPSIKAFIKAGFANQGTVLLEETVCLKFVNKKPRDVKNP